MADEQHLRIFGDKIEQIAEGLHQHHHISKCEAMGIVGVVMMDKWGMDRIKLTPAEVRVVEGFILGSCLDDTEYIFRYTAEAEKIGKENPEGIDAERLKKLNRTAHLDYGLDYYDLTPSQQAAMRSANPSV